MDEHTTCCRHADEGEMLRSDTMARHGCARIQARNALDHAEAEILRLRNELALAQDAIRRMADELEGKAHA